MIGYNHVIQPYGYYSMAELIDSSMDYHLSAIVQGLLFVSPGPVSPAQLASFLGKPISEVEDCLRDLGTKLDENSGLSLQWHSGRVQLTTAPQLGELVEKFLGLEINSRLSRAGLETLAILAYQQPVTRPQIDAIRGVSSDGVLKSLLSKGLIQEAGRTEGPGRPILYATTSAFLQYFGLNSVRQLPPLDTFSEMTENLPNDQEFLKE
jgi:segregation and condensation protein B